MPRYQYILFDADQTLFDFDRAEGEALGERISLEVLAAAAPYADGAYLMTPFQRVDMMSRLIVQARQVLR